jgi:hypothetical protein
MVLLNQGFGGNKVEWFELAMSIGRYGQQETHH